MLGYPVADLPGLGACLPGKHAGAMFRHRKRSNDIALQSHWEQHTQPVEGQGPEHEPEPRQRGAYVLRVSGGKAFSRAFLAR